LVEVERRDRHARKRGGGDRQARLLLELGAAANDAAGGATEQAATPQPPTQQRRQLPVARLVVRRDERHDEVGHGPARPAPPDRAALAAGGLEPRGGRRRRAPPHADCLAQTRGPCASRTCAVPSTGVAPYHPGVNPSFAAWASTAEAIGATTKRLEKGAALAGYLAGLDDGSLAVAARFFGGTVFPHHDARTTQVGPSLLTGALMAVAGAGPATLRARGVVHGDAGDLAAELLAGRSDAGLSLEEVATRLAAIGAAPSTAQRRADLEALLGALGPREARYLVRLLMGEPRIGLKEAQGEEALAAAFERPLAAVRRATLLRGDLGEVAQRARAGTLDSARLGWRR